MLKNTISLPDTSKKKTDYPILSVNTLIIGAGAAGLKCADTLYTQGVRDIAIVVDKLGNGTSNNSGSDKQTYYKMGVFGQETDSPMDFAETLYQGGMMHGDLAYIEGLGSLPSFFELCRIGVPFPFNKYGAYVGYKTDHDPRQRATSAGPKTSIFMYKKLLQQIQAKQIPILDYHEAVKLLTEGKGNNKRVCGAICLNKKAFYQDNFGMTIFNAENVVMATGGPGELFKISVWPHGQIGSHGLALEIGAAGSNLTELQYGLASTKFRWNLSGTYQQVIPDFYSIDKSGEKRFFLHDYFEDMPTMATNIFLKGYQWPFHAERLQNNGSSIVDIAVHNEIGSGRKVFMDFMNNPTPSSTMSTFNIADLHDEARTYLERSGATQETPYQRLQHMNQQSIDLYAEHNIDLRDPLEIAVCAQHCNGGLRGDIWWQTGIPHLFAIGELNGTHGVRPGGSALNSGQVGAVRSAQYISNIYNNPPQDISSFTRNVSEQIIEQKNEYTRWLNSNDDALDPAKVRPEIQKRMSAEGAFIRNSDGVKTAVEEATALYQDICKNGFNCKSPAQLAKASQDKALALTSISFLETIRYYIENDGGSRGGYMILDETGSLDVNGKLKHRPENRGKRGEILETTLTDKEGTFTVTPVPTRPLPEDTSWFETTWTAWNNGEIIQ